MNRRAVGRALAFNSARPPIRDFGCCSAIYSHATEIRSLALPGHVFRIVALDGNPVPTQADVPVLWLGTAERIPALVEMNRPGVWVMGDLSDDDRMHGMGIVV
jgi:FtsP/CotA-like multicopper oxidase with cupredoxin domain